MEYDFTLSKPLPQRAQPDYSVKPSAEQRALVQWITAQVLRNLKEYLILSGQTSLLVSDAPLHLFELNDELCAMLGLDNGCIALMDVLDASPKLVWSDIDLAVLQRLPLDHLRNTCRELTTARPNLRSFNPLTNGGLFHGPDS